MWWCNGKQQPPWCRDSRIDDSDGVAALDRYPEHAEHSSRRPLLPPLRLSADWVGRKLDEPVAVLLAINRAKESPREIEPGALKLRCQRLANGYALEGFIAAAALTGYSPADQPALGFSYAVIDRELGWQTFTVGPELPFIEDPSLWGTLELTS